MGLIRDAFGWIARLTDQSIDGIDVTLLEEKLRGTRRLQLQWERQIGQARKDYEELISPEKNMQKSPLERTLAIQKAKIAAKRVKDMTSAVGMLYKISGTVEQVKMLKKFYADLQEAGKIPGGLSLGEFVKQVDTLGLVLGAQADKITALEESIQDVQRIVDSSLPEAGREGDQALEKLFEKLQTLTAEGKAQSEEAAQVRGEINKSMGLPESA